MRIFTSVSQTTSESETLERKWGGGEFCSAGQLRSRWGRLNRVHESPASTTTVSFVRWPCNACRCFLPRPAHRSRHLLSSLHPPRFWSCLPCSVLIRRHRAEDREKIHPATVFIIIVSVKTTFKDRALALYVCIRLSSQIKSQCSDNNTYLFIILNFKFVTFYNLISACLLAR